MEPKKTWLMVKADLEAISIKYETAEGFTDFYAAGRHSHVSGLVSNGVWVAHAKEFVRQSNVRMAAVYRHLGRQELTEALGSLPALAADKTAKESGQPLCSVLAK
jgi:hypothetical protein